MKTSPNTISSPKASCTQITEENPVLVWIEDFISFPELRKLVKDCTEAEIAELIDAVEDRVKQSSLFLNELELDQSISAFERITLMDEVKAENFYMVSILLPFLRRRMTRIDNSADQVRLDFEV